MRFKITTNPANYAGQTVEAREVEVVTLDEVLELVEAFKTAAIDRHVLRCQHGSGFGAIDYSGTYLDECANSSCAEARDLIHKYAEGK